jgi:hypothetical protein
LKETAMSNRPEVPVATGLERFAYGLLAAATGIGLLAAVAAAFQSQFPDVLASPPVVAAIACAPQPSATPACVTPERLASR